jgi:hypothetical protein
VVQFGLLGPWVLGAGRESFDVLAAASTVGLLVLWVLGVRAAWHRRAADELRLHALLAAVWLLAVVSISRIFGRFFDYTIRWVWFVAALTVAASVWSLTRTWSGPSRRTFERATAAVAVAVLVLAAVQFGRRAEPTGFADGEMVEAVMPATVDRLDPAARHLVQWYDYWMLGAIGFGTLLELERSGFDAVVLPQFAAAVLPHRTAPDTAVDAMLVVVSGSVPIERFRASDDFEELAFADIRTDDERRRAAELRAEIGAELDRLGLDELAPPLDGLPGVPLLFVDPPLPPALHDQVQEYVDLGQPLAVFRAAPGTPIDPPAGGS